MPRPATPKLSEYRRKRDPEVTPEPFGGAETGKSLRFVVQRHAARSLHYDFRLERDGVLLSWAVPKGIPLEPGQRVLAVHVEDHPLDYADFAGEIPAGQYGAGTVEIWDRGTYELVEEKRGGGLTVALHGERLEGLWTLVPAKMGGDAKNWLLIRKHGGAEPPAERREYRPMLATLAEEPPTGAGWLFEVKWDGFRALARVRGGEATLTSRNDNDLTARFEPVARALPGALRTSDCVLDGEVCALDERGRPSFSAMQQGAGPLVYYVFDLLELEGEPLVALPLSERRARLAALVDEGAAVKLSAAFDDGDALLAAAKQQGLEGILAKRADSRYTGRRSREWLKIKTEQSQEFVIAGYTRGHGRREGSFGALVLGVHRGGELVYAGNVGTGFSDAELDRLLALLRPLERAEHAVRDGAEAAEGEEGRRRLGRARARGRGRVRRVDARPAPARAPLPGPARGQGRRRGAARGAAAGRAPQGEAACSSSRTSTSRSGPRRGSRRAISSPTTARSRPSSCRTCAGARSR